MVATVRSVNVGKPRTVVWQGRQVRSAIWKEPVDGPLRLEGVNFVGDDQADRRVHGGPDKAVYLYPAQHYAHWAGHLGRDLSPFGYFGENLTVAGADEADARIGDVVRAGRALLEVSQPRVPCFKLAMRMGDHAFGKPFLASGRVGYYLRVLEEGEVGAGDEVVVIGRQGDEEITLQQVAEHQGFAKAAGLGSLVRETIPKLYVRDK